MDWWPDSYDSVAWHVDLITAKFPALNLNGDAAPGLTWLRSMYEYVADGFNTPNYAKTSQDYATPHGRVRQLCAAAGIYKLSVVCSENIAQRRAGQVSAGRVIACLPMLRRLCAATPYLPSAASEC